VVKSLRPSKPTALLIFHGEEAPDYARLTDVLMIDHYPVPWLPLASFGQHVGLGRAALGPDKPLIAVVQAFDWNYFPELLPAEKNLRPPNFAELRCMTYSALTQRANGLFFYAFEAGGWRIREHLETWDAVRRIVAEVNERLPLFEAEPLWWPKLHAFGDPERRFNAALQSSVSAVLLRVRRGTHATPAGDYVLAVNTSAWSQEYRFTSPRPRAAAAPVLAETRQLPVEAGWLADHFEPYAVHIYGPFGN